MTAAFAGAVKYGRRVPLRTSWSWCFAANASAWLMRSEYPVVVMASSAGRRVGRGAGNISPPDRRSNAVGMTKASGPRERTSFVLFTTAGGETLHGRADRPRAFAVPTSPFG